MQDQKSRIDVGEIKARADIETVVRAFCPGIRLTRRGKTLVALSPFKAERTPSFTIDTRKQVYFCFAADHGGDSIRFVMRLLGVGFVEAAERIAAQCLGSVPTIRDDAAWQAYQDRARAEAERMAAEDAADERARIATARKIWDSTVPADGTLVETYLLSRGIDLAALATVYGRRIPASLRFHPALRFRLDDNGVHVGPAMVGVFVDAAGQFRGVHRTFLAADGRDKAKIAAAKPMKGAAWGAMGVLSPHMPGAEAVLGEGYETTLTAMAALARRRIHVNGFSGLSLGNIAGGGLGEGFPHPLHKGKRLPSERPDPARPGLVLPPGTQRLTLLEDADGKDPFASAARTVRAIAKFKMAGVRVRTATPERGKDFNDMANRRGTAA